MKVLVMGGSRFVGLHVVREMDRFGHEVTTFSRGVTEVTFPGGVRRLLGDRHDHEAMRETFRNERFDVVVDTSAYLLPDVESMVDIFGGRIGHYIFMCTPAVYGVPKQYPFPEDGPLKGPEWPAEDYGRNKVMCEEYLADEFHKNGFAWSSGRIPIIMGPHNTAVQREQLMFHRLLQGRPVLIPGDGSTLGHGSYIPDMAVQVRKMLLNPRTFGEPYNLAMDEYYSDESWVDSVAEVVGVEPQKIFVPHDVTTEVWKTLPYQLIQRSQAGRPPWYRSSVFDTRKYTAHTGGHQEHSLKAALEETYEWFRHSGLDKTFTWDFSHEDALIERLRTSGGGA